MPGTNTIAFANGTTSAADSICGISTATAIVTGTTSLSMVHTSRNANYLLTVDPFLQGAIQTAYILTVIDKSAPAQVTVRVVSRSGEYHEESYSYQPQSLTGAPVQTQILISPRAKPCFEVELTNPNNPVLRCTELTISNQAATINSNDLPVDVPPNTSMSVQSCVTEFRWVHTFWISLQFKPATHPNLVL